MKTDSGIRQGFTSKLVVLLLVESMSELGKTAELHALSSSRSSDQILPPMLPPRVKEDVEPDALDNGPEPVFF